MDGPPELSKQPHYDGGDSSTRSSSASPTERRHDCEDSSSRSSSASPTERRHDCEVSEDVPDKLIADLSQRMPRQWKLVATYLGFINDQVITFDTDNHSVSEKVIAMLGAWKQRQTKDATRSNLMKALEKAGRKDLAEEVCSYQE